MRTNNTFNRGIIFIFDKDMPFRSLHCYTILRICYIIPIFETDNKAYNKFIFYGRSCGTLQLQKLKLIHKSGKNTKAGCLKNLDTKNNIHTSGESLILMGKYIFLMNIESMQVYIDIFLMNIESIQVYIDIFPMYIESIQVYIDIFPMYIEFIQVYIDIFPMYIEFIQVCIDIFPMYIEFIQVCIDIFLMNIESMQAYIGIFPMNIEFMQTKTYSIPTQIKEIQTKIADTEKAIDKLVYGLYDLTDEEIELIENQKQVLRYNF